MTSACTLHPAARLYILPCIAGHVGADAAGVALSEGPQNHDETTLVVDVGTNAEILLGNRSRVLACLVADRARLRGWRRFRPASAPLQAPSSASASIP